MVQGRRAARPRNEIRRRRWRWWWWWWKRVSKPGIDPVLRTPLACRLNVAFNTPKPLRRQSPIVTGLHTADDAVHLRTGGERFEIVNSLAAGCAPVAPATAEIYADIKPNPHGSISGGATGALTAMSAADAVLMPAMALTATAAETMNFELRILPRA